MRMLIAFLSITLLLPSCNAASAAKARQSIAYPIELQGVWDLGPESCKLPLNPDSDSPIRVEKNRLRGYEREETPVEIKLVSTGPHAWVVSATSNIAPDVITEDLYILKGEHLVISDGESVKQYRRCE
ncbi:hypothetical protein [Xanthomonas campestris]|uniref:Lipoprotein n=1 Tax=Xanthomonas campestris pv. papavericola TaxID=487881 RepID=A0AAJ2X178_XANCA|nr:hypothetical protein [Xanthomonas campestris]MEC3886914.1 hypothetical protein [Xanthomonas campestris pv. papavericola]